MRVAIGEAVVRISRGYIACYRHSVGEDGTKRSLRSQQEETAMEDGGGKIPFFSSKSFSLHSLPSEHLDQANAWGKVTRENPAYLIFFFFFNAIVFVIIIDVKNV